MSGMCFINSVNRIKFKFERQIDLLDLVDGRGCAWIIKWENYLINTEKPLSELQANCKGRHVVHMAGVFSLPVNTLSVLGPPCRWRL